MSIEAKELRIGNYIQRLDLGNNQKRIEQVIEISEKATTTGAIKVICDYNDISPIKLTEQWLIDLGFIKPLNASYCELCEIELDLSKGIRYFIFGKLKSVNLEYVHQLQNLYHALTGKELIKQ